MKKTDSRARASSLAMLELILSELERGHHVPPTAEGYLREVCRRALDGDPDPLRLKRPRGNQPEPLPQLAMARAMEDELTAGDMPTRETAAQRASDKLGLEPNGVGGAVDKAHRAVGDQVRASRDFYAALNSGSRPPKGAVERVLGKPKRK